MLALLITVNPNRKNGEISHCLSNRHLSLSASAFVVTATLNCQALREITSFSETWQRRLLARVVTRSTGHKIRCHAELGITTEIIMHLARTQHSKLKVTIQTFFSEFRD